MDKIYVVGATVYEAEADYANWYIVGVSSTFDKAKAAAAQQKSDEFFGWFMGPIEIDDIAPPGIILSSEENWDGAKAYYSDGTEISEKKRGE